MGEDQVSVHLGEGVQFGVAVRGEEIIPPPRREVVDLPIEVGGGDESARRDRRGAGPIAFVVAHDWEVRLDDLGAGRFEIGARRRPGLHHRGARLDSLSRGPADAAVRVRPGLVIGIDVHPRHPEPFASQHRLCRRDRFRQQRSIGVRAHRARLRDLHPGLDSPEIPAGLLVVGDDDVENLRQIGHRASVGDDDVHGRHERPVPAHADDSARRGVGDERIVRGRSATR